VVSFLGGGGFFFFFMGNKPICAGQVVNDGHSACGVGRKTARVSRCSGKGSNGFPGRPSAERRGACGCDRNLRCDLSPLWNGANGRNRPIPRRGGVETLPREYRSPAGGLLDIGRKASGVSSAWCLFRPAERSTECPRTFRTSRRDRADGNPITAYGLNKPRSKNISLCIPHLYPDRLPLPARYQTIGPFKNLDQGTKGVIASMSPGLLRDEAIGFLGGRLRVVRDFSFVR